MGVSVVIATYNRAGLLKQALRRIAAMTRPMEVVVVDDGGDDDTAEVAYLVRTETGLPVVYVYTDNPGWTNRCHASNVGLKVASGDEILYTDAEVLFVTDVVRQFLEVRSCYPDSVVCAGTCHRERRENGPTDVVPGGNVGLYKRDWLMKVGGWDEALPAPTGWDDADLHTRLAYSGHPQLPIPGVVVRHQWHELHPWNEPGQSVENPNLAALQAKRWPRDIVANQGREWGVPR